jgi:hypothetical protein
MLSNFVKISIVPVLILILCNRIRDPEKIIPDPGSLGSKKGPDPGSGSGTLGFASF